MVPLRANQRPRGSRLPRPREKRLVCPDLRAPKEGGRVLRLGAGNRRHLRKSANPRGAQRPREPEKARPAKRAALAGHDRRNRVAKPEAAAHHRAERSTVPRNRVCVVPRKNDIRRGLKGTHACASAKIWAGLDSNQRRRKASRFTVCPVWPLRYLPVCER